VVRPTAKPIVFLSMPTLVSQKVIVPSSRASGKPLEMPRRSAAIGRGLTYGAMVATNPRRGAEAVRAASVIAPL
jgi:hypothetical protein